MAMKLQYNIENIGNIDKASVTIKPLTIIAGGNSTGKTFVTKSLYTILSHIKEDYIIDRLLHTLRKKEILDNVDVDFKEQLEDEERYKTERLVIAFKKNFQITNLESLVRNANHKNIKLIIENLCELTINNNLDLFLNDNKNNVKNIGKVVFFDSPVYIKIRKALQKKPLARLNYDGQKYDKYLKGYPKYIDDLYTNLDLEYIDIPDFNDISQEIQEIISGKLNVTKGGDINYSDKQGNTIPLSLTAMGISNIGLIDLLLRNNVINKGSFLIMDEPEVHLHPEWQVFLAEILYKIAKGGANIILATHSLDFLKQFEVILKRENENAEEIIAINKMPYKKEFEKLTELEKVNEVLDDLSKPFYNLYMQGI